MHRDRLEALRQTLIWLRDTDDIDLRALYGFAAGFDFGQFCDVFQAGHNCGSHMCLAGWYVFKTPDCGLRLSAGQIVASPSAPVSESFAVLAEHFELPSSVVLKLFMPPQVSVADVGGDEDWELDLSARKFWCTRCLAQLDMLLEPEVVEYTSGFVFGLGEVMADEYPWRER